MSKTSIKKQLKPRCLTSHIQNVMKLNFASSQKLTIFALVNQQRGLPRESAFSIFRLKVNLDTSSKHKVGIRMIAYLDCIRIPTTYTKWSIQIPYLLYATQWESKPNLQG